RRGARQPDDGRVTCADVDVVGPSRHPDSAQQMLLLVDGAGDPGEDLGLGRGHDEGDDFLDALTVESPREAAVADGDADRLGEALAEDAPAEARSLQRDAVPLLQL